MTGLVRRGLAAGAVGTTALNAVTYLDMLVRGRPPSTVPESMIERTLATLGVSLPGGEGERSSRVTALGALSGIEVGLLMGVVASAARSAGARLPAPFAAAAVGVATMAATDAAIAASGVSNPRDWSGTDWAADVVPHLAYGAAAVATLRALDPEPSPAAVAAAPPSSAQGSRRGRGLLRSAALGFAAGGRSSLAVAVPLLASTAPRSRLVYAAKAVATTALVGAELVADKLPTTPSRLRTPVLASRVLAGAGGAAALARQEGASVVLPAVVGGVCAAAGAAVGVTWREYAAASVPDVQAALAEDAVALGLAGAVVSRSRATAA
jgi:uncharacterized membrane protein